MAFPTGTNTAADLAVFIPEVWGQKINDFYKSNLVFADFFTDRSDEVMGGGDTLYTPNLTEFTATAKANATAVALNSPTETAITLVINQWYESSFAIEDAQAAQVMHSYSIMERYAKNAGYAIAKQLETAIGALFTSFSQNVGTEGTAIVDAVIREAIATLEGNDVPVYDGDVAFFMHPTVFWNEVQAIDKFSLAINSPVNDPTAKRPAGYLYGIPVHTSTNVPTSSTDGYDNMLIHEDAIHFATSPLGAGGSQGAMVGSEGIRVQSGYRMEFLSTITIADILYGVIENRDNAGVVIFSDL